MEIVKQPKQAEPVQPEEFRAMAASLNKIQDAARAMNASGLTPEALRVLIQHQTKVPMRDIKLVMDALHSVADRYLTREYRATIKKGT